jgi:hypothetical protein
VICGVARSRNPNGGEVSGTVVGVGIRQSRAWEGTT